MIVVTKCTMGILLWVRNGFITPYLFLKKLNDAVFSIRPQNRSFDILNHIWRLDRTAELSLHVQPLRYLYPATPAVSGDIKFVVLL